MRQDKTRISLYCLKSFSLASCLAWILFAKLSTLLNSFHQGFFYLVFCFFVVVLLAIISILLLELPFRLVDVEARIRLVRYQRLISVSSRCFRALRYEYQCWCSSITLTSWLVSYISCIPN